MFLAGPTTDRKLATERLALNRFKGLMDGNIVDSIPSVPI